jgi:Inner membrane component of T3SS, cytoplasmic domain
VSTGALVGLIILGAVVVLGAIAAVAANGQKQVPQRVCGGCRRAMLPQWPRCMFCGWAPVARLEFILGPMANQTLALTEEVTTIGSVAGNTVVLADPAVSRKHAGIRRVQADYELADFGSTNGVYVNGHKVPKKTLEPGDIIRVGNTEAVFKRE